MMKEQLSGIMIYYIQPEKVHKVKYTYTCVHVPWTEPQVDKLVKLMCNWNCALDVKYTAI